MRVAIIGRRHPSGQQVLFLDKLISGLNEDDTIILRCCDGIESLTVRMAKLKGIKTIGCIPWTSFKERNRKYCSEIVDLSKVDKDIKKRAYESVGWFRHWMNETEDRFLLMARDYLIVSQADKLIALISKGHSGGSIQGIRVAQELGIPAMVIDDDGTEMTDFENLMDEENRT
jgi:hypothetical protein